MSIKNLDFLFNPRRIAVVGASEDPNTLGFSVFRNLVGKGFKGAVYPVNTKVEAVQGVEAYQKITAIPRDIDLALLTVPVQEVLTALDECGQKEVKAAVLYCPDYRHRLDDPDAFENQVAQISQTYDIRVLGPNSVGFIRTANQLNTSLFPELPPKGNIAFISQSATLSTALLDRVVSKKVGLSYFVSVGTRLDIDTTDLIDYLAMDRNTRAIVLYLDAIRKGRKFMTAVRTFASTKPIVVVKSGKSDGSARTPLTVSGFLAGEDKVYDAAFKRAGAIRVDEILDLFYLTETLSRQTRPKGNRLAIVSNAGGPTVLAVDTLMARGGDLARLSPETEEELRGQLSSFGSVRNPVDLFSDCTPRHYDIAIKSCLKDEGVDGLLVIHTPSFGSRPRETAEVVVAAAKANPYKPVLTCWMGDDTAVPSRDLLNASGIPTFVTTEQAVRSFVYMYRYDHNLKLLRETPRAILADFAPDKDAVEAILAKATEEKRLILDLHESKEVLAAYGIKPILTVKADTEEEAITASQRVRHPVALKIDSGKVFHRVQKGRVIYNVKDGQAVAKAYRKLKALADAHGEPGSAVLVEPMNYLRGIDVVIGATKNATFGSVIVFGLGGELLDAEQDYAVGLPPLNQALARNMMSETRIYRHLQTQDLYADALKRLEEVLVRFSQLVIDFPFFKEIDINPFFFTPAGGFVMDSRMLLEESILEGMVTSKEDPCPAHLSICPYPERYVKEVVLRDGTPIVIRPIRPEDEPLIGDVMKALSEESFSYRFCQQVVEMSHERLVRYCQVDYDRELAFVAVTFDEDGNERIVGDVRVIKQPDLENAEVAILVIDTWQGKGLGRTLMEYCLRVSREIGLKAVWMEILKDNTRMLHLGKLFGFKRAYADEDMIKVVLEI